MKHAEPNAELNAIEEVAAAWLVERDRGLTAARAGDLRRWLKADERHAAAFAALAETWALLGEGMEASADEEATRGPEKRVGWAAMTIALAAAAAVALGVFAWKTEESGGGGRSAAEYALTAATEVGAVRTITLPDGSVMQLNTDSAVDVRFGEKERRVRLTRGEAHFTVAKNAARPFVVSAGGVDVRVVGTVFNVRLRSEAVDVLVTEGKVRVQQPAAAEVSELRAGQRVSVDREAAAQSAASGAKPVTATPAEVRQALAWQTRRLDFDAAPLSEIVAEINRYNRHKLVIADAELEARRFGGSFPANDYETLVRMLEADFGVVAERKGGETWLRVRRR